MKKLFYSLFIILLIVPVIWVCSSGEEAPVPLQTEAHSYMAVAGRNTTIRIVQGSGEYDVISSDNDIALAGYTRTDKSPGSLAVTGVQPGKTKVKISDRNTGEEVEINVYVTSPYFAIRCEDVQLKTEMSEWAELSESAKAELLEHPLFTGSPYLFLMKDSDILHQQTDNKFEPYSATYEITGTKNECVLTINAENETEVVTEECTLTGPGKERLMSFMGRNTRSTRAYMPGPSFDEILLTVDITDRAQKIDPEIISACIEIWAVCVPNDWFTTGLYEHLQNKYSSVN